MIDYFVPSDPSTSLRAGPPPFLPLLGNLLPRLPPSVARAHIDAVTRPNDLVLDPFCVGTSVVQAAIDSGRRVIAASFNPIATCAIESALWPVDGRAALTHLADTRRGDQRLRDHVLTLYDTRCPTCGATATAQSFTWDRDTLTPIFKIVACPNCGLSGGATDADDLASARRHEPRGLPFWLLHSKVVPRESEDAERVSEALGIYTPRALNAIADILLKFEGLPTADRSALRPPLIGLLDAATSVQPADADGQPVLPRPRPRSFRPPPRFIEHNVWLILEALTLAASAGRGGAAAARAPDVDALCRSPEPAVCLLSEASHELGRHLPPRSVDLLLARPPLPDATRWTLGVIWTAWLWGRSEATPLLPILSQRRTNWDWQWRAIASALNALWPALKPDAPAVLAFNADDGETALDGVMLAAAGSGAAVTHALCDPFDGYRIHARPSAHRPGDRDREALADDIEHMAREAAIKTLRARNEPTAQPILHTAILEALAKDGTLSVAARLPEDGPQPLTLLRDSIETVLKADEGPFVEVDSRMWWLSDGSRAAEPLADQVEIAALELIRSQDEWDESRLLHEVYRRLPGDLTPERPLVATCIASYSEESADRLRLRVEDQVEARTAEVQAIRQALTQLGTQMGYTVESRSGQITWKEQGAATYVFVISPTAETGALWRFRQMPGGTPVLVIPGSRATLFQHKLARNARLRQAVEEGAWQFLKFGAVRELLSHADMDRRAFALALGLNPPIEQSQIQIPLW